MEVLQKELVQVQTLMDRMTREREEESERLKNHYEQLQANYTTSEVRKANCLMSRTSNVVLLMCWNILGLNFTFHKFINMHIDSPSLHNLHHCVADQKYSLVLILPPFHFTTRLLRPPTTHLK